MSSSSRQSFQIISLVASCFLLAGCTSVAPAPTNNDLESLNENQGPTALPTLTGKLTQEQAQRMALDSDCAKVGKLTDVYFYNSHSQTWWFDMDQKKTGCNPACVVNELTKKVEINWRCTGGLAPRQPLTQPEVSP